MNTSKRLESVEFGMFCGRNGIILSLAELLMKAARAQLRASELACSCPDERLVHLSEKRATRLIGQCSKLAGEVGRGNLAMRISHDPRGPVLWACINGREFPVPDRG